MVCEPTTVDEKVYVADPLESARDGLTVVPSTAIPKVPVGVAVLELEAEATLMVMASFAPGAGVLVAAESVVVEATSVAPDVGHA
jgi:hypothetical protein